MILLLDNLIIRGLAKWVSVLSLSHAATRGVELHSVARLLKIQTAQNEGLPLKWDVSKF